MADRSALLHLIGNEAVLAVKEQDAELLDRSVTHERLQIADQGLPVGERGPRAHFCFGHAAGDLPHKVKESNIAAG